MKRWVIALHCLLFSCVSQQQERDASQFNGDWQALMRATESVQLVEDLRFDCAPFTESFFLRVQDGVVSGFMEADENYSFVVPIDGRGRFRAMISTNSVYTYKDAIASRESTIVLVLEGRLSGSGVFVVGDTALDGQGCSTEVRFVTV